MNMNINEVRKALENIINLKGNDNSSDEIFLGSHYNEMLKFEELIAKINLSQHHRILENALKREIPINYDALISFIVSQLNNNEDFNILLSLIDVKKIKRTDLFKIMKCPNFRESMLNIPKYYFIESIENDHKQISNILDEIKNEIQLISKKNDENMNSMELKISNLFNQFVRESISQINLSINNNIMQSKTDILNSIKDVSTLVGNQNNSIINSINDQVGKLLVNIHNNIDGTYNKIDERINSVHKNIDEKSESNQNNINEKFDILNKNIDEKSESNQNNINEKFDILNKNIDEKSESNKNNINEKFGICDKNIENKFNSLVNEINEIKVKLLSTSSNLENNSLSIKTEIKDIKDKLKQNNININNNLNSNLKEIICQLKQNSNNDNNNLKSSLNEIKNQLSLKINDSKSSLKIEINSSKNLLKENIRSILDFILFKENLPITFNYSMIKSPYFDGLFNFCFKKIGNPFKNKIFEITGNPEEGYEDVLYEIFDNKNERDYKSKNTSDSYLQIDFKNRSFCFNTFQIYNHSANGNTIKKLKIEGSDTGSTWELIGNWNTIDESLPVPNCSCGAWLNTPSDRYYRFIKIQLNGPNTSDNYHLCLKRLELYGILK